MGFMRFMETDVARLKRTAKFHYQAHANLCDRYSCGVHLAAHVNPDIGMHADKFNAAMKELETLDPLCPKWERLEGGQP